MKFSLFAALAVTTLVFNGCSHKKEIRTVELGAKAEIGPFIYKAFDTHWPFSIGDRVPTERFFTIRITALNSGTSDATVPSFELVDDSDNAYPELSDGSGVDGWMGLSRKVGPGQSEQGTIVFDVPARHYRLRVSDENDNFMYIDVPFDLSTETPDSKSLQDANPSAPK